MYVNVYSMAFRTCTPVLHARSCLNKVNAKYASISVISKKYVSSNVYFSYGQLLSYVIDDFSLIIVVRRVQD